MEEQKGEQKIQSFESGWISPELTTDPSYE